MAFKDGQFSYTVVANISPENQSSIIRPIAPEKVVNYEFGLRTSWLGGRLRFNPTGYYDLDNRQSSQQQACPNDPSCPAGFRIVGAESPAMWMSGGWSSTRNSRSPRTRHWMARWERRSTASTAC